MEFLKIFFTQSELNQLTRFYKVFIGPKGSNVAGLFGVNIYWFWITIILIFVLQYLKVKNEKGVEK